MSTSAKSTRVGDAYQRLKTDILSSALPAGFQAPEPDIAARLGMSRTPVREALIRLEAEGLVSLIPRRGALVVGITPGDLAEIYELLAALEPVAAAGLARKGLSCEQQSDLEHMLAQLEEATSEGDLETWAQLDRMFQCTVAEFYGNGRLYRHITGLFDQAHRARLVLHGVRRAPTSTGSKHAAVLAAIIARDASAAEALTREHRLDLLKALHDQFANSRMPVL